MQHSSLRPFLIAIGLATVLAARVSAADVDPAGLVPAETQLFVGWRPGGGQQQCELLDIAEAIATAPLVTDEAPQAAQRIRLFIEFLREVREHPAALSFMEIGADDGGPLLAGALVVQAAGAAEQVQASFRKLTSELIDDAAPEQQAATIAGVEFRHWRAADMPFWWGVSDGSVIVTNEQPAAELVVNTLRGDRDALSARTAYVTGMQRIAPSPGWGVTVFGVPRALLAAMNALAEEGAPDELLEVFGLRSMAALIVHLDQVDYGPRFSSYMHMPDEDRGFLSLYWQKPLDEDTLKLIPKAPFFATAFNFSLQDGWKYVRDDLLPRFPEAGPQIQGGLAAAGGMLGFSLTEDFLPAFGDTWILYDAPETGGLLFSGWVMIGEAKQPVDIDGMLERIVQVLGGLAASAEADVRQKQMFHHGHEIDYVLIGPWPVPVAPAWAIVEGRVVFGLFPQTVAAALDQIDPARRSGSILDNADYQAARATLPHPMTAFSYIDARSTYRWWYALELMAKTAVAAMSDDASAPFDLATMPVYGQKAARINSSIGSYTTFEDGALSRVVGFHPHTLIFGADGGGIATTAMLTSIMLPSLSRARELAKRAVVASNLRGIGQAIHFYAAEHDGEFPPDLEVLLRQGIITEEMRISPRSGARCVYIPGQSTESDVRNVVAYEPISGEEGTSVLFLDGHVEWMKLPAFKQRLLETYQRLDRADEMPSHLRP